MSISISNALSALPKPQAKTRARSETDAVPISEEAVVETEEATVELSETAKAHHASKNELLSELMQRYESLRNGNVTISGAFLQDCLSDESKLAKLHEMLQQADVKVQDAEENLDGYQWMEINIDADGNMESTTYSGKVGFNAGKIARMLAAAKSPEQVRVVLGILNSDLAECKAGAARGMCDESEVAKVQAMIQKAMQKMGEVSGKKQDEQEQGIDTFMLSMLI